MALSNTEKNLVKQLRSQGYSLREIEGFIGGKRVNRAGSIEQQRAETLFAQQPVREPSQRQNFFQEARQDIKQGFEGMVEATSEGIEKAQNVRSRVEAGETTPVAGTFQTIGAGLGAGAEVVGNVVLAAGKSVLPEKAEEAISKVVAGGAEAVVKSRPAQEVQEIYNSLSEEQKRNVDAMVDVGEGVGTMFGFSPVVNRLGSSMSKTTKAALTKSDDILKQVKRQSYSVPTVSVPSTKGVKKTLNKLRLSISEVDEQVETVLQRSNFDEVNSYFQHARTAKSNNLKSTPLEVAADKAEIAYSAINEARKSAVQGKISLLNKVAGERVPGNTINGVMADATARFKNQFGARVTSDGGITQMKGRLMKLDKSDQRLISEYMERLNSLGVAPTVKEVDDFVDWAQSQLYKQTKTVSKFEVASEPVVKTLQGITGDLNGRLKQVVGGGYGEVNARVSRLIELQDELSRALGAEGRKGAGLMKRLFSPSGGNTRAIFEEIKKETGIDLAKEATLAKFAMETVGDTRQASLIKQVVDSAEAATSLNILEPGSWFRALRERVDLDGQELANEILRQKQK